MSPGIPPGYLRTSALSPKPSGRRYSNAADLDLRIVEAGAFGEIGLEIRRDQSRNRLPGAARRQPRPLLTGNDTRRHIRSHDERQDDLAALVP